MAWDTSAKSSPPAGPTRSFASLRTCLPDALGSVRQLANETGAALLARAYEPFGSPLDAAGRATSFYGFAGEWIDQTGLAYLRARYCQPQVGRFFQQDPLRGLQTLPQSMNPYAYGVNNPALYTDPGGKFPFLFLAMLAVGTPIIAGVTTAAWDLFVSQGVGLGGRNQFRFACADWSRPAHVGRLAAAGAVNSILSIPLGPLYLIEQLVFGLSPDETNLMIAGWFGLGSEYQALLANPYFQVGQAGGVVGSTAISLFLLSHGVPLRGSSASQLVAQTGGGHKSS